jgi:hypothetical protein
MEADHPQRRDRVTSSTDFLDTTDANGSPIHWKRLVFFFSVLR